MGFCLNEPQVGGEILEGEVIVIDFVSGAYYSLTGAGAVAYVALVAGGTERAATNEITRRYDAAPDRVVADVRGLLDDMLADGLLREHAQPGLDDVANEVAEALGKPPEVLGDYETPTLARYTDMQQLLLLDPVHEVGDGGWPTIPDA